MCGLSSFTSMEYRCTPPPGGCQAVSSVAAPRPDKLGVPGQAYNELLIRVAPKTGIY